MTQPNNFSVSLERANAPLAGTSRSGGRQSSTSLPSTDKLRPVDSFGVVREGYDRIGSRYRDASRDNPLRLRWVNWMLDTLSPGSLVLDLGCGAGEPATRLLADRHRVVGVDASLVQLRMAKQAVPSAALVQADMTRLALRPESFDAVVSLYAFGHVAAADHVPLLRSIAAWLRPGGWLLASLPVSAGDTCVESWFGVPMFFGGTHQKMARRAIEEAQLRVDQWTTEPEVESDGRTVEFVWVLARKLSSGSRSGETCTDPGVAASRAYLPLQCLLQ